MRRKLGEILLSSGVVSPSDIADALSDQSAGEPSRLGDLLVARGRLTPVQLAQALAVQYEVPFTLLPPLSSAVLEAVPLDFQRQHHLVPIRLDGAALSVAMADLSDADAVTWLKKNWPQLKIFVAAADEIDAFHAALSGEALPLPKGSSPSAEDLFGSLDFEAAPPAAAEPPVGSSGMFELKVDEVSSLPPLGPSGMYDINLDDVGVSPPVASSGTFELKLDELGQSVAEEPIVQDSAAVEEEEALFFEARPSSPSGLSRGSGVGGSAAPVSSSFSTVPAIAPVTSSRSPVPAVAPVSSPSPPPVRAAPSTSLPPLPTPAKPKAAVLPARQPSEPRKPSKAGLAPVGPSPSAPDRKPSRTGLAAVPPSPSAPERKPPLKPSKAGLPAVPAEPGPGERKRSAAGLAPVPPDPVVPPLRTAPGEPGGDAIDAPPKGKASAGLDLPDWLKGDGAAAAAIESAGDPAPSDARWSGELEALAPSRLITGVARALIRKGILTEQDVLDALERKKS